MRQFIPASILCCGLILAFLVAGCTTMSQENQTPVLPPVTGTMTSISADNNEYPVYLAAPSTSGKHPGIVLLHSFNGLEKGYKDMIDRMAGDGFVVIAPEWQTYGQRAGDPEV
ncbi:MAG TPA: dienelactone hydrolase family protein, partial [Methanoregulaceae archaeon]|nr:dienelactone hydrolase family protein [Methanoregulaceae archaeon]